MQTSKFNGVVYLSKADYDSLVENGSITKNGQTLTYNASTLYVTPDTVSNPTLLINGNFQVNQRGKSSYYTQNAYCVDRWRLVSGIMSIDSNGGGIYLDGKITQTLEKPPVGNVVASVDTSSALQEGDITCSYAEGVFTIIANNKKIGWAKLEYGSTPTQFVPKPYADELLSCQRYLKVFSSISEYGTLGTASGISTSSARAWLKLDTPLRTTPTLSYSGTPCLVNAASSATVRNNISNLTLEDCSSDYVVLLASATAVQNRVFSVASNNDTSTQIVLDAEIY